MSKGLNILKRSFAAGVLIGISGIAYLSCPNKIVGAFLFAFGLLTICELGLCLFTGMAGFTKWNTSSYTELILAWCGNFLGADFIAIFCYFVRSEFADTCVAMTATKLDDTMQSIFIKGLLCGAMMFLAVYMFRTREGLAKYLWIVLCVPIFILSGFEHSIADIFYMSPFTPGAKWIYIVLVSVANFIGAKAAKWLFAGKDS